MRKTLVLTALVVALAACGEPADAPSRPVAPDAGGHEGVWELVSGRGPEGRVAVVAGHPITLELNGNDASGRAACNLYGGSVTVDGSAFAAQQLGGTEMGCAPAVMESEQRYYAALPAADRIDVAGDEMTLTGPETELVFRRVPPVPTAALTGTRWELETIVEGDGPAAAVSSAAPAFLRLSDDGTFTGSTGCRALSGTWAERNGEIYFDEMSADGTCEESLRDQDGHVVNVLGDGFAVEIEGDTLTVSKPRAGGGLVYRAG